MKRLVLIDIRPSWSALLTTRRWVRSPCPAARSVMRSFSDFNGFEITLRMAMATKTTRMMTMMLFDRPLPMMPVMPSLFCEME
ncbi:MAG: hypothetical protein BWY94_01884 [Actinobacteria bacterium ADurb.BinA094]|nr:MAG: hypothetical protein BWY94_01884 [Actinobacteria bacterium ADurb.BinA094]